jgi:Flp pilus assembly protein protease CpaA
MPPCSWVAGFGHLVAGNVDVRTMAWLLTGSIPGVLLSSQFTLRIPDNVLRLGLAAVLMLSGIKLIDFAGADYVIAAGAIAAGLGFAIWGFVARLGRRPRPETVT